MGSPFLTSQALLQLGFDHHRQLITNWGQWHDAHLLGGVNLLLALKRPLGQTLSRDRRSSLSVVNQAAHVRMTSMGIAFNPSLWTFLLVTSTSLLIPPVDCQFQRMPEDSVCAPGTTCVLITECPRLLDILKQVKNGMGGADAKREIFSNHCGFKVFTL